jgi:hypothetical protein
MQYQPTCSRAAPHKNHPRPPTPGLWPKLHAAVGSAEAAAEGLLKQLLAGVDLAPAEAKTAGNKLKAAGKAKLGSLLQVGLAAGAPTTGMQRSVRGLMLLMRPPRPLTPPAHSVLSPTTAGGRPDSRQPHA